MNNDELKKKITHIVIEAIWKDAETDYDSTDETEASSIADALIAAGIGDVKDLQAQVDALEITNIALQAGYDDAEKDRLYWVNKYKEAEHRADVAERALRNRARKYVDLQGYPAWDIAALADEIVVPDDLKQSEKELAEENGGKKKV